MAFLDDLNKAVGIFDQGIQQLRTTEAFNRANEEIGQIQEQIFSEAQQRQQQNQIAQQLSQELLQAGAPVSQAGAAQQLFGAPQLVSPTEQIQVGVEADDVEAVRQGQEIQAQQLAVPAGIQARREQLKAQAAAVKEQRVADRKLSSESRGRLDKTLGEFRKDNSKSFDALASIDGALTNLATNKDPSAVNTTIITALKLAGESGRLSDEDFVRATPGGRSAVQGILRRLQGEGLNPQSLARDRAVLTKMIGTLGLALQDNLSQDASRLAEAKKGLIPGRTTKEITDRLQLRIPRPKSLERIRGGRAQRQEAFQQQGTAPQAGRFDKFFE